jgi:3-phenylpropionate/trans-cinnamate dioxygenase ferredoxin reductase component
MRIVVAGAGAGLAAQRCCAALRRLGHDGPITLVGEEPLLPYDRPPLSKEWLACTVDEAALLLRPPGWYAEHGIDVRLQAAPRGSTRPRAGCDSPVASSCATTAC